MNKPTLAAIGAFVVLLLAFFATREKAVSVGVKKFDVPAISTAAIDSVTVTGANAAKLERGANGWTVADPAKADVKFPADDAQVQAVLSALAEFKAPDFVNDKADKHAEYEVTNDKGTTVAVSGGGKSFTVILGKASKSGGTYVRKADGDAVFVTQSAATWQVKRNVTAWRKRSPRLRRWRTSRRSTSCAPMRRDVFAQVRWHGVDTRVGGSGGFPVRWCGGAAAGDAADLVDRAGLPLG